MKTNEIVHEPMSLGQLKELAATAVGFVPNELTSSEAQLFIENKSDLNIGGHRLFFDVLYKIDRLFPIVVDYSLPFAEMVEMGRYDEYWSTVTEGNFPVEGNGVYRRTIRFFKDTRELPDVLEQMKRVGANPAKIEDLLALGAQYPHLQQYFTVFASGSERDTLSKYLRDETVIPILGYLKDCRRLILCESDIQYSYRNRVYAGIV